MEMPLARVRMPTAPSKVMSESCERPPLIVNPPEVSPKLKPLSAPPRTPGFKSARNSGLRPFRDMFWICICSTVLPTVADSVLSCATLASTVTLSDNCPTARSTLTASGMAASSLLRVLTAVLNPAASTVMV